MDLGIKGKRALVCASSKGLGLGCAEALADAGVGLVMNARGVDALEAAAGAIRSKHSVEVTTVAADVTTEEGQERLLDAAGPLDILVTNAGGPPPGMWSDWDRDDFIKALDANMLAPIALITALMPDKIENGWGRIVNFASLQSTRAFPGGIGYGATKGGVTQLTRAMAEAWSPHGITANAIGPGFFPTELTAAVFDDPDRAARNAAQTCIGRNGTMQDMDGPLLFLCSQASAYVTGQVLMVDGGFTAK